MGTNRMKRNYNKIIKRIRKNRSKKLSNESLNQQLFKLNQKLSLKIIKFLEAIDQLPVKLNKITNL